MLSSILIDDANVRFSIQKSAWHGWQRTLLGPRSYRGVFLDAGVFLLAIMKIQPRLTRSARGALGEEDRARWRAQGVERQRAASCNIQPGTTHVTRWYRTERDQSKNTNKMFYINAARREMLLHSDEKHGKLRYVAKIRRIVSHRNGDTAMWIRHGSLRYVSG